MSEFRGSFLAVVLLAAFVAVPAYAIQPAPQASQAPAPIPDVPFHLVRPNAINLTSPWTLPNPNPATQLRNNPTGADPQARPLSQLKLFEAGGVNAQMGAGGKIQYNFSDVKPLGGALGGQVSGNSAKLTLKWRDSN